MGLFSRLTNKSRDPTPVEKPTQESQFKMVTAWGEYYMAWDGKLYKSDIIRACIRPKVKAIGKLVAKHIQEDANGLKVDQKPRIAMLLKYPNPYMTEQVFLEKMATQLCLSNNAFALIVRDDNGFPVQMYPVPASMAEAVWNDQGELYIRFTYQNGKTGLFRYSDILHLRQDYNDNDIFGSSPAPALTQLMECVGVIDQGIVKAIKNSGVIRWLLKFTQSMRPEDIQNNVKTFVNNYLTYESETFGAAGVDSKADAIQIKPNDYVPNATLTDRITERIYSFFNTNKNIVQSSWTENEWTAYYEAEIEPVAIQFGECLTERLFSRRERSCGNRIVFEASNLQCASLSTKLNFVQLWDRGIFNANEIRAIFNMAPIPSGDQYYVRLDNAPVDGTQTQTEEKQNLLTTIIQAGGEKVNEAQN
ncbi:MAG: phage portal protein [Clostridiales bacterium]|nr:phage portal protein [Clostridiales bacterium]